MPLPPIHPALVYVSIVLVIVSFAADLLAKMFWKPALGRAAFWALFAGTVSAWIAIASGYWDASRATLSTDTSSYMDVHVVVGWIFAALLILLTIWRWRIRQQARRVVTKPYALGALSVLALTLFQTWYGTELVYSHGAGVAAAGQGVAPAIQAQEGLARIRDALTPSEAAVGGIGEQNESERGPRP